MASEYEFGGLSDVLERRSRLDLGMTKHRRYSRVVVRRVGKRACGLRVSRDDGRHTIGGETPTIRAICAFLPEGTASAISRGL
jgi:hypothetical protein